MVQRTQAKLVASARGCGWRLSAVWLEIKEPHKHEGFKVVGKKPVNKQPQKNEVQVIEVGTCAAYLYQAPQAFLTTTPPLPGSTVSLGAQA